MASDSEEEVISQGHVFSLDTLCVKSRAWRSAVGVLSPHSYSLWAGEPLGPASLQGEESRSQLTWNCSGWEALLGVGGSG